MREDLLPRTYEGALIRVIQEAGEVIQAVTKLQQYGEEARDPLTGRVHDNVEQMLSEFNDLQHAMDTIRRYHLETPPMTVVPMPDIPIQDVSSPVTVEQIMTSTGSTRRILVKRVCIPSGFGDTLK